MKFFLFLLESEFPASKSIAEIFLKRYSVDAVKRLRSLNILILKFRKTNPILSSGSINIMLNFLVSKQAISSLKHSRTYD